MKDYGLDNLPIFTDAAARDAAIPAPFNGQMCVVLTPSHQFLVYHGASPAGWFPPWNVGWGLIYPEAVNTVAQNIGAVTVDVTNLSVTWTPIQNRYYEIEGYIPQHSFNAVGLATWMIRNASNAILGQNNYGGANVPIAQYLMARVKASIQPYPYSGPYTVKLSITSTSTDLRIACSPTQPGTLTVKDVGPVPGT